MYSELEPHPFEVLEPHPSFEELEPHPFDSIKCGPSFRPASFPDQSGRRCDIETST